MMILYGVLAIVWGLPIAIILATSVGYGVSSRFARFMRIHLGL
jgi:hypothetical protein